MLRNTVNVEGNTARIHYLTDSGILLSVQNPSANRRICTSEASDNDDAMGIPLGQVGWEYRLIDITGPLAGHDVDENH